MRFDEDEKRHCSDCPEFEPCPCGCGCGVCRKWSQWAEACGWCVDWSAE